MCNKEVFRQSQNPKAWKGILATVVDFFVTPEGETFIFRVGIRICRRALIVQLK